MSVKVASPLFLYNLFSEAKFETYKSKSPSLSKSPQLLPLQYPKFLTLALPDISEKVSSSLFWNNWLGNLNYLVSKSSSGSYSLQWS